MKKLTVTSLYYGQCHGHTMLSIARIIPEKEKQLGLKLNIQTKKTQNPAHVCQATQTAARETNLSIQAVLIFGRKCKQWQYVVAFARLKS